MTRLTKVYLAEWFVVILVIHLQSIIEASEQQSCDVVFVIDSTVRMKDYYADLQILIEGQLDQLARRSSPADIRVAFVDYKDCVDSPVANPSDFYSYKEERAKILENFKSISISGGGDDYPECVYTGLMVALQNLSWDLSPQVSRTIFLLASAPPHTVFADFPTQEQAIEIIRQHDIGLVIIGFPTLNNTGARIFEELARSVDGLFLRFRPRSNNDNSADKEGKAAKGGILDSKIDVSPAGDAQQAQFLNQQIEGWLQKKEDQQEPSQQPEPLPSTPQQNQVTISRYPTIVCPTSVMSGEEFAVQVSLTEEQFTPEVKVMDGALTHNGALSLSLPNRPQQESWKIDVVLLAPGFSLRGSNFASLILPLSGDSTPVLFYLCAESISVEQRTAKLYVTLWHEGVYLAKVVREIEIVNKSATITSRAISAPLPSANSQSQAIAVTGLAPPDLTLLVLENNESGQSAEARVIIASPYLQPSVSSFTIPQDLSEWLQAYYAIFSHIVVRGASIAGIQNPSQTQKNDSLLLALNGFGKDLYVKYAPPAFKEAFWRLKDKLGAKFQSIQIISNNPVLPWELMCPMREDRGEGLDFLGIEFRIARWHLSPSPYQLDRPPQSHALNELVVIAPQYQGMQALSGQMVELQALDPLQGYHLLPGQLDSLRGLLQTPSRGIIHFAGHGIVEPIGEGVFEYAICLEDMNLDLMSWRSLVSSRKWGHPFIFFNACDVGQAHRFANFVTGWAPAVLESGASGYIGGLWPLRDQGAAEFAAHFYEVLYRGLLEGPVAVTDVLRDTRRLFYENGDPTYLAYVYYGDPNFQFVQATGP